MQKIYCQSCKQEIPLIEPYVQFNCPECGKPIARCESCPLTNANVDLKDHKLNGYF